MTDLHRGDRVKRWRKVPRRWQYGEIAAVLLSTAAADVIWDGRRKPERVPLSDLRPAEERTTTTGRVERRFSWDRNAASREATPKEPPRTGGVSERYRRWVRTLPCAWCRAPGPSEANHEPRRGMDGGKRDDLNVMPLCAGPNGCHDVVTRTNRLGSMTPEDTQTWMRERIVDLLKMWIRGEAA